MANVVIPQYKQGITMHTVHHIPVSQPGEYLCEIVDRRRVKHRYVTTRSSEAARMERRGATVFCGRAGGWVRKD